MAESFLLSSKLQTGLVGVIVLKAGGYTYVCTSLSLHMVMDNIPSASVVVGCGKLITPVMNGTKTVPNILKAIAGKRSQNPEDLLKVILDKRNKAYLDMVDCSIYECVDDEEIEIFRGVIIAGNVNYKSGTPTTQTITFHCLNKACKLFVSPLGAHYNVCGAGVVAYLSDQAAYDTMVLDQTKMHLTYNLETDTANILSAVMPQVRGKTLDEAITALVDKIIESETVFASGADNHKQSLSNIKEYLFSSYKVNVGTLTNSSEDSFCEGFIRGVLAALKGNSIYNAVQTVLLSTDYMLRLAPRWQKNDFKLEITPSTAWDGRSPLKIDSTEIIAIDSLYEPLTCLNTPDAFIVHFDSSTEVERNQNQGSYLGVNGVFSLNDTLMDVLRKRFQSSGELSIADQNMLFKAKFYSAPKWMTSPFMKLGVEEPTGKTPTAADKELPETHTGKLDYAEELKKQPIINKEAIRKLADELAVGLFNHLFGMGDTAFIRLLPNKRYKDLESNLGRVVDVTFDNTGWFSASPLNIRGVLEAVHLEYTAGSASSMSYAIKLSRVRPLDKSEKTIECPLYVKK